MTFIFSLSLASFVKICGVHKHLIRLKFKHILCSVISTLLKNFTRNMKNSMLRIPYKHWIVFSLKSLGHLTTVDHSPKVLKKTWFFGYLSIVIMTSYHCILVRSKTSGKITETKAFVCTSKINLRRLWGCSRYCHCHCCCVPAIFFHQLLVQLPEVERNNRPIRGNYWHLAVSGQLTSG